MTSLQGSVISLLAMKKKEENKLIELGSARSPKGLKGEFRLQLFNLEDSSLKKGTKLWIKSEGSEDYYKFELEKITFSPKVIGQFKEVQDRTSLEKILPFNLYIERCFLPRVEGDSFYLVDLLGLSVLDENKNKVGVVEDYYENGAQTVLILKFIDGELQELPFVESFFPDIDIEKGYISFVAPEYI